MIIRIGTKKVMEVLRTLFSLKLKGVAPRTNWEREPTNTTRVTHPPYLMTDIRYRSKTHHLARRFLVAGGEPLDQLSKPRRRAIIRSALFARCRRSPTLSLFS